MYISDKIKKVTTSSDFVFWTAKVGKDGVCDMARVSGFIVDEDNERVTFFIPESFFKHIRSNLLPGLNISLLMVSVKNFESYQIKGNYISHKNSSEENIDYCRLKVLKAIDIVNEMGMNGQGIFGYLLELPSIAVTFQCRECYLQTPKPGTGTKLTD